ncbi:MAG: hypothetical protein PHH51_01995 [Bacilli bacterium]|nr:hypothetical protein [Bacilli bacterium]MDD3895859.1 hypothetical protein [Bacilli bacterium]
MENVIYYTYLFDYYKELLTITQKNYFEDYYFNNLSLQEIADNNKISKNAISKTIKEVLNKLDYFEKKLKLYHNHNQIKNTLNKDTFKRIEDYI